MSTLRRSRDPKVRTLLRAGGLASGTGGGGGLRVPLLDRARSSSAAAARAPFAAAAAAADGGGGGAAAAAGGGGGGGGGERSEEALSELALLWAISSLHSLDALAVLLPDDGANLSLCRLLARSAALLPAIHERQTVEPQLLVRLVDPSYEETYRAEPLAPFRLTLVSDRAAVPNLFAEILHPDAHWSLDLDNELPLPPGSPAADPLLRSHTAEDLEAAAAWPARRESHG